MKLFVGPFYALFMLGILFASFFIVFHLANYSVNRRVSRITILVFCVGMAILLFVNVALFLSTPFDTISSLIPSLPNTTGSSF
ncbi:MAG: hypothetical protein IPJ67_04880 [Candidatus Moraniibacteriota bacterium]|nr:MAG: hypothetical protein IPJ67_04880 [Candidatus Moranbacteria bacterium]